ncbi:choline dehydrogenase-like flavoprotein [Lipingzhangella halophila]|uniref:Choline dehydrogenase-like flavoprotein n=1 Tax=Lipingzhangella halophila TaxID=1783352 RepID=A0A7W7RGV5_9ACTN|nr:GMC family oxidoreductase [Lipingzhangella halophila]MBB4931196.1 choline dehydrogenase-like flavoprotein [Lipingzhangella halophila]
MSARSDDDTVDHIIVGAGSAGCALAHRLVRDSGLSVLLVEAGPAHSHRLLRVPKGFARTVDDPRFSRHYPTAPSDGRASGEPWIRGRGVGGSSLINGMIYNRGSAADHDAVAAAGNPGWGWTEMLSAFRALEDHGLGASPLRGTGGPLPVEVPEPRDELSAAILRAGAARGLEPRTDLNASDEQRIGPIPSTIRGGARISAAEAFLRPLRGHNRLRVLDRAQVGTLLFDGRRVRGVRLRRDGAVRDHFCRGEVVLCAGAVEDPLLLERSGIGDAAVLGRAGLPVRVDSPHVGERVLEHRGVSVRARLRRGLGRNRALGTGLGLAGSALAYLARRGPLATGPYDLACFLRSTARAARPDAMGLLTGLSVLPEAERLAPAPYAGLTFTGYALRPTTASSVHAGGPDPADPPVITPRFLESEEERRVTAAVLEAGRALLASEPLRTLVEAEEAPGPEVQDAEGAYRYAMSTGGGLYHAVGSCAMGAADTDAVDSALRVRGIEGLRVADASVFPMMPSGNTAAPVMAAAWHAAGLMLRDQ